MKNGRLIAVVGPSGVGKDSVLEGLAEADPSLHLVRRTITRAPELGGEDYDAVSVAEFNDMAASGKFALHWGAHDLLYGIPASIQTVLARGQDCLANFSRSALLAGDAAFAHFCVLSITGRPETLASRLKVRGRESEAQIAKRLAQAAKPLPNELKVMTISNDGALEDTVANALSMLQPVRV
ncbi:phosphonate metabolism protein/1,5-bisphosphokinase (PRPP-forming) PhnN [Sulfitobacter mediterraneus]|uniref:Ribose 1,5-bisphosphate phosphokinase PhnN n=1 Tax=Sulfitobacter mediterraneus TaxID=83219 RepID=A0A2T6CJX1_9RHOB|nr:phosphonate metabolism protein/1,5-bisphosphokinase (PRPP-forming) PhnN [Sulfitobacter mediterraneus]KIN78792.1 Phosphonate metabolism protein/1,5-bisphosphokinase (PRPP-forming) PhnN [Sulfitobacter mediterraneus KCTC 32188]PTX75812.1 ribose 1,5-bisphosphokinase [Sulfitobacter mediterraneus]